jgi:8-oxo-dGTP diphosphatase
MIQSEENNLSREYPHHPIAGVAGLTIRNNQVLLTVRGKPPRKGYWGIPGGVVEVGETLEQAVEREVFEETGVRVNPVELVTIFDSINKDDLGRVQFHYILFEYLCEYVSGDVRAGDDAPDAKWITLDNLDSLNIMPFTRTFIERTITERKIYHTVK